MAYSPKSQIRRRQLRSRTSAQDREPALLGQPVQRGLHHRTDMLVHLGDVGVLAELRGDVDLLEDLGDNLRRRRKFRRESPPPPAPKPHTPPPKDPPDPTSPP